MSLVSASYSFASLRRDIVLDLRFYGGTSLKSAVAVLLYDARFRLMCSYRFSRYLYLRRGRYVWLHRILKYRQRTKGANDLSPKATIGAGIVLPHPIGIVIGEGVVIEDGVTIYQHVTFGSHGRQEEVKRYPIVCERAKVFAGATVIGGVRIGREAVIGANSVVVQDVPDFASAAGVPARLVSDERRQ